MRVHRPHNPFLRRSSGQAHGETARALAAASQAGTARARAAELPTWPVVESLVDELRALVFPILRGQKRRSAGASQLRAVERKIARLVALDFLHQSRSAPGALTLSRTQIEAKAREAAQGFVRTLPSLATTLAEDVRAAYEGDPAAAGTDEVILCYPGVYAISTYRLANQLFQRGARSLPRMMTEHAHVKTGVDIHPGATIGRSFFIDHGTGVVIGETTVIGDRVRLYQGVTLGALSLPRAAVPALRGKKRHPTLGDDVIVYANATILGGDTVIGAGSVIGGNSWITHSVEPGTRLPTLNGRGGGQ